MNKLLIRNIGPIKNGSESYLEINNLTIFLGPQGSGKSTVAKIYSSLSWLQKVVLRDEVSVEQCEEDSFFIEKVISYQGIQGYFKPNAYIHFIGKGCEFKYENGSFKASKSEASDNFKMPKIMYVPAERNFLTAVARPEFIKGLPRSLYSFLEEYEQAKQWVSEQEKVSLPIGGLSYSFDKESNKSYLQGENFKSELLHSSSGFQSLVPLFVVTEYLANLVLNKKDDPSFEFFSVIQRSTIEKKILKLFEENREKIPAEQLIDLLKKKSREIVESYQYKSFINIVEEPEQNLYPESQKQVLFNLIKNLNKTKENELIITSHSPYILNFITLCTEAKKIYEKDNLESSRDALIEIVPKESAISIEKVSAYELDDQGDINIVGKELGMIDDRHSLNAMFEQINESFSKLLDMD